MLITTSFEVVVGHSPWHVFEADQQFLAARRGAGQDLDGAARA